REGETQHDAGESTANGEHDASRAECRSEDSKEQPTLTSRVRFGGDSHDPRSVSLGIESSRSARHCRSILGPRNRSLPTLRARAQTTQRPRPGVSRRVRTRSSIVDDPPALLAPSRGLPSSTRAPPRRRTASATFWYRVTWG